MQESASTEDDEPASVLERLNWDGEYRTSLPADQVAALQAAARLKQSAGLFGVGEDRGHLAIFASPHAFDPATGQPATYLLSSLARIPLPGSAAARRVLPAGAGNGYRIWEIVDLDPRTLHATQDNVRSDALAHYLQDHYRRIGALFDTVSGDANDDPVIVDIAGTRYILTGHHRSVAALLRGIAVTARYRRISTQREQP